MESIGKSKALAKARYQFMGQYLGIDCISYNGDKGRLIMVGTNSSVIHGASQRPEQGNSNIVLQLRELSQLNSDELLQVGIIAFPMFVPFPERDHDTLRKLSLTVLDRGHLSFVTHQLLCRYGVLVPFVYVDENEKPIRLSTEEIINLKWAEIKEA